MWSDIANPVVIGGPTKKSDYDLLYNNTHHNRDTSGNINGGTAALDDLTVTNVIAGSINGNSATASAVAGTGLTGSTLASNITASSLTSVGTLANLTVTNTINGSINGNAATATTANAVAASAITGSTLASGVVWSSLTSVGTLANLTVTNTINGSINGNANYATSAGSAATAGYATSAGSATTATNANYATSAGSATTATNANYATSAGSATTATNANYATSAGSAATASAVGTLSELSFSSGASIGQATSDGADNGYLFIGGGGVNGGGQSATRGAYIRLHGNQYTAADGDLWLIAGRGSGESGSGAQIYLYSNTNSMGAQILCGSGIGATSSGISFADSSNVIRGYFTGNGSMVLRSSGQVPSAMGAGSLNAVNVYDLGTLLTCYVIEAAVKNKIDLNFWDSVSPTKKHKKAHAFAARWQDDLDIDKYSDFWKRNLHLSSMPGRHDWKHNTISQGVMVNHLWETIEIQAVHIDKLNQRLKKIERMLNA